MIDLTFNLATKVARLVQAVTIKPGGGVPVRVTFSAAPNALTALSLALGSDATPPAVLAYAEDFTEESETVWTALLDAGDTRLVEFMAAKSVASVNAELTAEIDGETAICPNVSVTVQHRVVSGDPTGVGGPDYYTEAEVDAAIAAARTTILAVCAADVTRLTAAGAEAIDATLQAAVVNGERYKAVILLDMTFGNNFPLLSLRLPTGTTGLLHLTYLVDTGAAPIVEFLNDFAFDNFPLLDGSVGGVNVAVYCIELSFRAAATGAIAIWWAASATAAQTATVRKNSSLTLTKQ